jgi:alginate O-acetyltransferase complex protein AlgI
MLISGFWHGAAWTFIIWGGLHALSLSIERATRWPARLLRLPGGRYLASFLLLIQVWVTWVFFRADSLGQAVTIVGRMFSFRNVAEPEFGMVAFLNMATVLVIAIVAELYVYFGWYKRKLFRGPARTHLETIGLAVVIVVTIYFRGPGSPFIYFQF